MLKEEKIITLAKYLLTKGVDSPLKIQKLLFFLRYEELKNKNNLEDSYFASNYNFQAWIYGPVNYLTYNHLQSYFFQLDEKENYFLRDAKIMDQIEKQYGKYFEKWNQYSPQQLVKISHTNQAWIKARGSLLEDEISNNLLDESTVEFITISNQYVQDYSS